MSQLGTKYVKLGRPYEKYRKHFHNQCQARTDDGQRCRNRTPGNYCPGLHADYRSGTSSLKSKFSHYDEASEDNRTCWFANKYLVPWPRHIYEKIQKQWSVNIGAGMSYEEAKDEAFYVVLEPYKYTKFFTSGQARFIFTERPKKTIKPNASLFGGEEMQTPSFGAFNNPQSTETEQSFGFSDKPFGVNSFGFGDTQPPFGSQSTGGDTHGFGLQQPIQGMFGHAFPISATTNTVEKPFANMPAAQQAPIQQDQYYPFPFSTQRRTLQSHHNFSSTLK